MKKLLFCLFLVSFWMSLRAQDLQLQSILSTESFRFTIINQKDINSNWDYFGYSSVDSKFDSLSNLSPDLTHLANRKIYKNFVATGGLSFDEGDIFPSVGLGYAKEKTNFNLGIYPTIGYGLYDKNWSAGLNSILEFTPVLKGNWHWFSLLILDLDYDFGGEAVSSQYISLGLEHKERLSFGLGLDWTQEDTFREKSIEPSFFVGFSF